MRRGDDADIHGLALVAAHRLEAALLQDAQQLGLDRDRHVADLVEEERAAIGGSEAPDAVGQRAGESAFDMPKQFAFQQRFRDGRTIDRDEGPLAPWTVEVDGARHDLLAGPTLAVQHHGRARLADFGDLLDHPAERQAAADQIVEGVAAFQLVAQALVVAHGLA